MRRRVEHPAPHTFVMRPPKFPKPQRSRILPNVLLSQRRDKVNVALVHKARAGIDVQAREAIHLGQADVQDGEITLQPFLLINHKASQPPLIAAMVAGERSKPAIAISPGFLFAAFI